MSEIVGKKMKIRKVLLHTLSKKEKSANDSSARLYKKEGGRDLKRKILYRSNAIC